MINVINKDVSDAPGRTGTFNTVFGPMTANRAVSPDYDIPLGWPVDYLAFSVNQGRAFTHGTSRAVDYVPVFGPELRLEARAAAAWVDGRDWEEDRDGPSLPTGAISPVHLPLIVGSQRLVATTIRNGTMERSELDGYATVDVISTHAYS